MGLDSGTLFGTPDFVVVSPPLSFTLALMKFQNLHQDGRERGRKFRKWKGKQTAGEAELSIKCTSNYLESIIDEDRREISIFGLNSVFLAWSKSTF